MTGKRVIVVTGTPFVSIGIPRSLLLKTAEGEGILATKPGQFSQTKGVRNDLNYIFIVRADACYQRRFADGAASRR